MYQFGNKYKFKSLRVYCSTEWMVNSTKKYRQVFDKSEVDYIRCELAFYNKKFDEEDWEATVNVRAFSIKKGKKEEVCNQNENVKVSKNQNSVYVHKGWGTDKLGGFWKKGEYIWEAYINEQLIGVAKFYIEDIGKVTVDNNPYFSVESFKLFAGPYDAWAIKKRKYLTQFDRKQTEYVWVEIKIKNKIPTKWHCELFINHYDQSGQPKAKITSFREIESGKENYIYTIEEGWGSKEGGTWRDDKYSVELIFMDTLVGVVTFDVDDKEIEGVAKNFQPNSIENLITISNEEAVAENPQDYTLEEALQELNDLIGLEGIKSKIRDHINYLDFLRLRNKKGFNEEENIILHSVFTGNPGTGKTTIVNMLAKIYHKMGLLQKPLVHEVDRVDLVGEFIGQTAPKVKEAIEEAKGGILFIDEAYMLARKDGDSKDFGKEVVEVLIKEMSENKNNVIIMLAGYPKEMDTLLNSNPGLRSRVKYYFHFDDYTPSELNDIAEYACKQRDVVFNAEAKKHIEKLILEAYRNRDNMFGNARFAYSLVDEGKMNLGLRVMKSADTNALQKEDLMTINIDDVKGIASGKKKKIAKIGIEEDLLRESLAELNALIGLENIKKDVNELIKLVMYYKETGKNILNKFSLHTVFIGNPGTGKTTITRIMGKIYKALGLLERGHIVECDREGLVAGYIGQTAIKTKERIEEAKGGVLFIDEAYSLAEGSQNSYGNEAIEVLLKNMEDMRGEFALIVAGYPENMEVFLKSNPGLKSRFDRTFYFKDFSVDELLDIVSFMLKQESLHPDKKTMDHLKAVLTDLHLKKDKYFGNARTIRKLVTNAVKNQNLRMAFTPTEQRTPEMLHTLTYEDIKDLLQTSEYTAKSIGFRSA